MAECDLLRESRDQRIGELGAARRRLIGARQITNIARQAFASGVYFGDRATNTGRSFELAEMRISAVGFALFCPAILGAEP